MRVFLDFEASSLSDDSYPIEVGWVFEDGPEDTFLIRPAQDWTDWDEGAEEIHGLSRERLAAEGLPVEAAAGRVVAALQGHEVFASAPSWDGKWLSVLLRAAGLPRHLLRLEKTDVACASAATEALGPWSPASGPLVERLIRRARQEAGARPVAHRALADARMELWVFRRVRELAAAEAVRLAAEQRPS